MAWFVSLLQVKRHIGLKIGSQLKDIVPAMIWGIVISYVGYLCGLCTENLYLKLVVQGIVSGITYLGIIYTFHKDLWDYILKFLKLKK